MGKSSTAVGVFLVMSVATSVYAEAKLRNFEKPHRPHQYIVHLKAGAEIPRSMFRQAGVTPVHAFSSSAAYLVKVEGQDDQAALSALAKLPGVAAIEANRILLISKLPNDPNYVAQHYHKRISSPSAWELSTGSKNVVVGVIDSGVNYLHPDLAANYWKNPGETGLDKDGNDKSKNQIDDDANGYVDDVLGWDFVNNDNDPMDDHGHGSHCAGVIGAKGDNALGISGINWDVSIVGLKFINGLTGEGDTAGAVMAIEYATAMGFDITNNSYGGVVESLPGPDEEDLMRDAIAAAGAKGQLFVAAAGNSTSNNDDVPAVPASYDLPNIISVAATTSADNLAIFSNFGPTSVHIAAPGTSILSTVLDADLARFDGTSMASPMVAGAAALLKSYRPDLQALELKERLLNSADPLPGLQSLLISGGRLNVAKALAE